MPFVERNYLTEQFESLLHDDNVMNPVMKVLDALEIIDTAPTADVVEVVRCEKCKYRTEVTECNHTLYFCRKKQNYIKLNDFCSYGTPKERGGEK